MKEWKFMTNVKFKFSALWQSRIRGQENDLSSKFRVCNDILYKHAISSIKTYQWDEQKDQEIISGVSSPREHKKSWLRRPCLFFAKKLGTNIEMLMRFKWKYLPLIVEPREVNLSLLSHSWVFLTKRSWNFSDSKP